MTVTKTPIKDLDRRADLSKRAQDLELDLLRERTMRMVRYERMPVPIKPSYTSMWVARGWHPVVTLHPAGTDHVQVLHAATTTRHHVISHERRLVDEWVRSVESDKPAPSGITAMRGPISALYVSQRDAYMAARLQLQTMLADLLISIDDRVATASITMRGG